jgi:hypothetical protein
MAELDPTVSKAAWADTNLSILHGYWKLKPDEIMCIHLDGPRLNAQSWNFQIDNYWMESMDYVHHPVTINMHTAADNLGVDGSVYIVVSHQENMSQVKKQLKGLPLVYITTAGHSHGTMALRLIKAVNPPVVNISVLPVTSGLTWVFKQRVGGLSTHKEEKLSQAYEAMHRSMSASRSASPYRPALATPMRRSTRKVVTPLSYSAESAARW